nr:F-box/kelch-repeat protein At3g23880-like [Ipomoea trifida]
MEASLSNIPLEIIRLILLQLPVKCVIRCQCVCKQWRSLIDDSDFKLSYRGQQRMILLSNESKSKDRPSISRFLVRSTSHDLRLRRHKWPFGEESPLIRARFETSLRVLCSCHGLVLLLVANKDIWLWNPSTKCSTKFLPTPHSKDAFIVGGLCYDSCTRDYKVVLKICPRIPGVDPFDYSNPFLMSASFNHKEWRPVRFPYNLDSVRDGIEFRNTFYWWASDMKDWDPYTNFFSDRNRIVYFDPVHDEFRILPLPTLEAGKNFSIFGLGVIDDCLCMAACIVREKEEEPKPKTKTKTIWIMKEYGKQESWMAAFSIQMRELLGDVYGSYILTFYSQKRNAQQVLFLLRSVHVRRYRQVCVYDRKKDEWKEDLLDFLTSDRRSVHSLCFYVESLAWPGGRPQRIDLER